LQGFRGEGGEVGGCFLVRSCRCSLLLMAVPRLPTFAAQGASRSADSPFVAVIGGENCGSEIWGVFQRCCIASEERNWLGLKGLSTKRIDGARARARVQTVREETRHGKGEIDRWRGRQTERAQREKEREDAEACWWDPWRQQDKFLWAAAAIEI
jgi:hypothetical protein